MKLTTTVKTHSLYSAKSYLWATVFVAANILLPQAFHAVSLSGQQFLPIMLFTIAAAACFGTTAGFVTAVCSPLISMLLFAMPSPEMTSILIAKGATAALVLGYLAKRYSKISPLSILAAIVSYQFVGFVISTLIFDASAALSMAAISWPAMLLQLTVGYFIIYKISAK